MLYYKVNFFKYNIDINPKSNHVFTHYKDENDGRFYKQKQRKLIDSIRRKCAYFPLCKAIDFVKSQDETNMIKRWLRMGPTNNDFGGRFLYHLGN